MSQKCGALHPQKGLKISKLKNANDVTQYNRNYWTTKCLYSCCKINWI